MLLLSRLRRWTATCRRRRRFSPKQTNSRCHSDLSGASTPLSIKGRCLSLLANACSSMAHLRQIHGLLQTSGLAHDAFLTSELLRFCSLSPSGCLSYARTLLSHAPDDSAPTSWNHVIRGHAVRGSPVQAVDVFLQMRSRGATPGKLTYPFLLKACAALADLHLGRQVHAEVVKASCWIGCDDGRVYVQNGLISMYGSCRKVSDAWKVFDGMPLRTVISWNAVLSAFVHNSWFEEAVEVLLAMRCRGFEPDETTILVMLSASVGISNLSLGIWLHSQMIGKGVALNIQLGTALVDMYAKCGVISSACMVFDVMPERNVWTWSAMILGLAQHGLGAEALNLFLKMKKSEVKPNYVTFLGVFSACSHAGLVDDGLRFFYEMKDLYKIEPRMSHYSAMADILGRNGRLEQAYHFIGNMPIEPDPVVWRTLLGACNINKTADKSGIVDRVRLKLIELEPRRCGNYVMVANMCAEFGYWEEVANFRKRMREEGLKKIAGESCIEVAGLIHRFYSGDDARVYHKDVYDLLEELSANIRKPGCTDTHML